MSVVSEKRERERDLQDGYMTGGGMVREGKRAVADELTLGALGAGRHIEIATAGAGIHREVPIPLPQLPGYLLQRSLFISFHSIYHRHFQFQSTQNYIYT